MSDPIKVKDRHELAAIIKALPGNWGWSVFVTGVIGEIGTGPLIHSSAIEEFDECGLGLFGVNAYEGCAVVYQVCVSDTYMFACADFEWVPAWKAHEFAFVTEFDGMRATAWVSKERGYEGVPPRYVHYKKEDEYIAAQTKNEERLALFDQLLAVSEVYVPDVPIDAEKARADRYEEALRRIVTHGLYNSKGALCNIAQQALQPTEEKENNNAV